jgi:hypothetical protein
VHCAIVMFSTVSVSLITGLLVVVAVVSIMVVVVIVLV